MSNTILVTLLISMLVVSLHAEESLAFQLSEKIAKAVPQYSYTNFHKQINVRSTFAKKYCLNTDGAGFSAALKQTFKYTWDGVEDASNPKTGSCLVAKSSTPIVRGQVPSIFNSPEMALRMKAMFAKQSAALTEAFQKARASNPNAPPIPTPITSVGSKVIPFQEMEALRFGSSIEKINMKKSIPNSGVAYVEVTAFLGKHEDDKFELAASFGRSTGTIIQQYNSQQYQYCTKKLFRKKCEMRTSTTLRGLTQDELHNIQFGLDRAAMDLMKTTLKSILPYRILQEKEEDLIETTQQTESSNDLSGTVTILSGVMRENLMKALSLLVDKIPDVDRITTGITQFSHGFIEVTEQSKELLSITVQKYE